MRDKSPKCWTSKPERHKFQGSWHPHLPDFNSLRLPMQRTNPEDFQTLGRGWHLRWAQWVWAVSENSAQEPPAASPTNIKTSYYLRWLCWVTASPPITGRWQERAPPLPPLQRAWLGGMWGWWGQVASERSKGSKLIPPRRRRREALSLALCSEDTAGRVSLASPPAQHLPISPGWRGWQVSGAPPPSIAPRKLAAQPRVGG